MLKVVFTGPAVDSEGNSIVRRDLIAACEDRGMEVQSSIRPDTTLLIASRLDTVKARQAEELGIRAVTYQDFIGVVFKNVVPKTGLAPDPYTDNMKPKAKVLPLTLIEADKL